MRPAISQLAVSADGLRGASLDVDGGVTVYDLAGGDRLLELQGAGPCLALSADGARVASSDGVLREVAGGRVLDRAPFHALPFFTGAGLLQLGAGRARLLGAGGVAWDVDVSWLDPSPGCRVVVSDGTAALLDPCRDSPALVDLRAGALRELPAGPGPVTGGCWHGGALLAVQAGLVVAWDPARCGRPWEERPFGWQALAVASRGQRLYMLGLDAPDRYLLAGPGGRWSLPLPPPPQPELHVAEWGLLAETWRGCAALRGDGTPPSFIELPPRRGQERSIQARCGRLPAAGGRVFLASRPPCVYDAFSGRILRRLEPWEDGEEP